MQETQGDAYWVGLERGSAWTGKKVIFNISSFNLEKLGLQVMKVVVLMEDDNKDFKRLHHAVGVNYR